MQNGAILRNNQKTLSIAGSTNPDHNLQFNKTQKFDGNFKVNDNEYIL